MRAASSIAFREAQHVVGKRDNLLRGTYMSIRHVNTAIAEAVSHAENLSGTCQVRPDISIEDAKTIASAAGVYAGDKEIAAIARLLSLANVPPAGQSALTAAMQRPRMTAAVRTANAKVACEGAQQLFESRAEGETGALLAIFGGIAAIGCVSDLSANSDDE